MATNKNLVPEAKSALDKFKMEAASEVGECRKCRNKSNKPSNNNSNGCNNSQSLRH